MSKKLICCVTIFLLLSCIVLSIPSFASNDNYNVKAFDNGNSGQIGNSIETAAGTLLYIMKIVAVGVGIIMLTVLAIKYMTSSANERATIKQNAVVYVIGAVVLFGAAGILQIIEKFVNSNMQA